MKNSEKRRLRPFENRVLSVSFADVDPNVGVYDFESPVLRQKEKRGFINGAPIEQAAQLSAQIEGTESVAKIYRTPLQLVTLSLTFNDIVGMSVEHLGNKSPKELRNIAAKDPISKTFRSVEFHNALMIIGTEGDIPSNFFVTAKSLVSGNQSSETLELDDTLYVDSVSGYPFPDKGIIGYEDERQILQDLHSGASMWFQDNPKDAANAVFHVSALFRKVQEKKEIPIDYQLHQQSKSIQSIVLDTLRKDTKLTL